MNEELQQALIEVITAFANSVGGAADFAIAQAPEVVQQFLVWKLVAAVIGLLGCVLMVLVPAFVARHAYQLRPEKNGKPNWAWDIVSYNGEPSESGIIAAVWIFGGVSSVIGLVFSCINAATALQVWLAPKVYLLEYAANLVK